MGFSKKYWDANYSKPETMDGIGNAFDHSSYLKSLFGLEFVEVRSLIDFGFGLGHLFQEMMRSFTPLRSHGLEPSKFAFKEAAKIIDPPLKTKLTLENISIKKWCETRTPRHKAFDLGICTSVLQYVKSSELEFILPILSRHVRYLYLTVPTDYELKKQREEFDFCDEYALDRTREEYLELLSPHFTFISNRVLESKSFFDISNSPFTEYLYRF